MARAIPTRATSGREGGAHADLILVDGNPLEHLDLVADPEVNFSMIMKAGTVYKNALG